MHRCPESCDMSLHQGNIRVFVRVRPINSKEKPHEPEGHHSCNTVCFQLRCIVVVFWDGPDSHFRFQRNIAALLRVEMSLVLQAVFSELGGNRHCVTRRADHQFQR